MFTLVAWWIVATGAVFVFIVLSVVSASDRRDASWISIAYKYPRGGIVAPMLSLIDLSRESEGDRSTVAFEQWLLAHWESVVWVTLQGKESSRAAARIRLQQHFD